MYISKSSNVIEQKTTPGKGYIMEENTIFGI